VAQERYVEMTAVAIEPEPVPLIKDAAGRLMIKSTRVPLDTLVAAFKRGESPESVQESYPTVPLADVYAVLAYYLNDCAGVEVYITEQERRGAEAQGRGHARAKSPGGLRIAVALSGHA
jgi:uncharacterized protein (DUF433 family)